MGKYPETEKVIPKDDFLLKKFKTHTDGNYLPSNAWA